MFSFQRYIVEHHNPSKDEGPTKRLTRGATRLRQLLIRRANCERTPIDIDVDTSRAIGPYADVFKSYFGILTQDKISCWQKEEDGYLPSIRSFDDDDDDLWRSMQDLMMMHGNMLKT